MRKQLLLAALMPLWAQGASAELSLTTGLDYSEGKYGSNLKTTQWTVPLVAKYEAEHWLAKLSLPYVRTHNVNPSAQGESLPCGGAANTPNDVEGFGDLVASGNYSIYQGGGYVVDLGGKVKFATGDTDKCLSSGKNDYSLQADITRQAGPLTVFGTLGWTKKGDPTFLGVTTDYRDPYFASLGGSYKISDAVAAGATYDYRQRLTSTGDPISELTLFTTYQQSKTFKIQCYLITGFSNASPDLGAGALATFVF